MTSNTPAVAAAPAASRRAVLGSSAPARPALLSIITATAAATVGLLTLVALGFWLHQVWLIPPLAASAALVFGAPTLPLAQPRSVIGGQLVSAVVGFAVLATVGSSTWSAGLAGGLALGAMMLVRTPHSPAAATAVIVVAQSPHPLRFLTLLAAAATVLVLIGVASRRLRPGPRYPVYWW